MPYLINKRIFLCLRIGDRIAYEKLFNKYKKKLINNV